MHNHNIATTRAAVILLQNFSIMQGFTNYNPLLSILVFKCKYQAELLILQAKTPCAIKGLHGLMRLYSLCTATANRS